MRWLPLFFALTLCFGPGLTAGRRPAAAISFPPSVQKVVAWLSAMASPNDLIPYFKKNAKHLLTTSHSGGQFGSDRVVFPLSHGETILSLSDSGPAEVVVDTHTAEGLKPYLLERAPGEKRLTLHPSTSCRDCHTADYTYIWAKSFDERFKGAHFSSGRLKGIPTTDNGLAERFNSDLVQRAASVLFEKIQHRHPELFARHFRQLMLMLLACEDDELDWVELVAEAKKNAPHLYQKWKPILEAKGFHPRAIRPLFLLNYLGVPPQSIFLFKPVSAEEDVLKSPEVFRSTFTNLNEKGEPFVSIGERFGPLGAYGGQNDDLRGYLLERLFKRFLPTAPIETADRISPLPRRIDVTGLYFEFLDTLSDEQRENPLCRSVRLGPSDADSIQRLLNQQASPRERPAAHPTH